MKNIITALDQIKWQRYRDGKYSSNDPLLSTQEKLRSMHNGEKNTLTLTDVLLLISAVDQSIKKIGDHNYELDVGRHSENLRQSAMQPLFDLKTELLEMQEALSNG